MNYLALAGAIITGLTALRSIVTILWVWAGKKKYRHPSGFLLNELVVAGFAPATIWLGSAVIA